MSARHIEITGIKAVRQLRKHKLSRGLSFMITTSDLSPGEGYLEYPNGKMDLVTAYKDAVDFIVIRHLSIEEANEIRKKHNLNV